uniref:Uncharacterized protein n=1 Tax=Salvator merianae TaxID=96440 RepID=A0A8D0C5V3_SALMN
MEYGRYSCFYTRYRGLSSSYVIVTERVSPFQLYDSRVPELQIFLQEGDGIQVHVKLDLPHKILYHTTVALTTGGGIYCQTAFYMSVFPRRESE